MLNLIGTSDGFRGGYVFIACFLLLRISQALKPENLILIESPSDFTEEETFKSANAAGTGPDESEMDAFKVCMPLVHDTLWSVTAVV